MNYLLYFKTCCCPTYLLISIYSDIQNIIHFVFVGPFLLKMWISINCLSFMFHLIMMKNIKHGIICESARKKKRIKTSFDVLLIISKRFPSSKYWLVSRTKIVNICSGHILFCFQSLRGINRPKETGEFYIYAI